MKAYRPRQHALLTYLPLLIAIIVVSIGIFCHFLFGQSWTTISGHALGSDDAYISYRYAENLFHGHGLVFNPSEAVEGYSNFLYTLLMLPAFYLGKDYVYTYSVTLNILFVALTLIVFFNAIKRMLDSTSARIGVMLLALSPFIWSNAATGLETSMVLCINLCLWLAVEKHHQQATQKDLRLIVLLSALSILTRIDGFLPPLFACLYFFIKKHRRDALTLAVTICLMMLAYTAVRYAYYGDIMGNTFYNKISGFLFIRLSQGLIFWFYYLLETGMYVSLAVYVYLALFKPKKPATHQKNSLCTHDVMDFALLMTICWSIYVIYTGGDIYYERFLITLLPMTIFLFLKVRHQLNRWLQAYFIAILITIPFLFAHYDGRFIYQYPKYDFWVTTGRFLKDHFPKQVLAADACGKIPFYSELQTIDMLGLNDRHIGKLNAQRRGIPGHTKFDAEYVLNKSPDIITAWINPTLNVGYGLNKALYQRRYRLHYLVNSSRHDYADKNIIDVTNLDKKIIVNLIANDYNYAILTKRH